MVPSPYKFLDAYEFEDQGLFFGREQEIKLLFADIVVKPLVVLFAKTGTGKTSLINAGLRPLLREEDYESYYIRVQQDPTASAIAAIQRQRGQPLPPGDRLATRLNALGQELGKPVILFFDQFEEFILYTVRHDPDAARDFVGQIAELYYDDGSFVHVVLSLREEFFVDLDVFHDEIPNIFHEQSSLRLRWFEREQAESAIEQPALAVGVTVQQELIDVLVRDLMESGQTVLRTPPSTQIEPAQLQIVCDTLWQHRTGDTLTLEQYQAMGTTEGRALPSADKPAVIRPDRSTKRASIAQQLLERRLHEEFERLETRDELDLLVNMLPLLATDRDTKRLWDFPSLRQELDTDQATLWTVLQRLAQGYLLHVGTQQAGDVIELTHDYLVERLDQLADVARLVWPRKVLDRASRSSSEVLDIDQLVDVRDHLPRLRLTKAEAELVLRSTLQHRLELERLIGPLTRSGVDLWPVLRKRLQAAWALIREGTDTPRGIKQTSYLLQSLAKLDAPEASSLLEWALVHDVEGWSRLETLAREGTQGAVSVLELALERGWLAGRPIALLPFEETEGAVAFFDKAQGLAEFTPEARRILRSLARSKDLVVGSAASAALGTPPLAQVERTSELSQHWRVVADEIGNGRVTFFLGPGANLCGRPEEVTWRPGQLDWLPDQWELARYLATLFDYKGRYSHDLTRVAQHVTLTVGAFPLYVELRRLFDADYPPTPLHRLLAQIPSSLQTPEATRYPLIVTTNYDDVLERSFRDAGEPFDLVTYDATGAHRGKFSHHPHGEARRTINDPNTYFELATDTQTVILKIHGTVNRADDSLDSFVITEDHFIEFLARNDISKLLPPILVQILRRSHCLFLGYSLQEWNLRVIINRIWGEERLRSTSWAVQHTQEPLDRQLWANRDVMVLDTELESYIRGLRDALQGRKT